MSPSCQRDEKHVERSPQDASLAEVAERARANNARIGQRVTDGGSGVERALLSSDPERAPLRPESLFELIGEKLERALGRQPENITH